MDSSPILAVTSSSAEYLGALCGIGHTYVTVSQLRSHLDTIPGEKIVLTVYRSGKTLEITVEIGEQIPNSNQQQEQQQQDVVRK